MPELSSNDDTNPADFIDLLAADVRANRRDTSPANIIKSRRITLNGSRQVEIPATEGDCPRVILHRAGDEVERVEFVCKCGRTASLHIQYEGE